MTTGYGSTELNVPSSTNYRNLTSSTNICGIASENMQTNEKLGRTKRTDMGLDQFRVALTPHHLSRQPIHAS